MQLFAMTTIFGLASADSNWCTDGAVCAVHNQGRMGSAVRFAVADVLEHLLDNTTSISRQQLLDCTDGSLQDSIDFTSANAVCTDSSYPFTGEKSACRAFCSTTAIPKGSVQWQTVTNEAELEVMAEKGPVVVSLNAASRFQRYTGGIISSDCPSTSLNHVGVLVADTSQYWRVKNSWGTSWGEAGFVRLQKGISNDGICGVAKVAAYPTLTTANNIAV